ncbi:MAG: Hydroxyacylglutathione hydrolase [Candidatus Thorarchaeota archaeon]|nr:MAG: Hydroxyacylglutathione hydrolase [Candidatus Thorarchaeota archaeon]
MIELEYFDDITCIKTATEQGGQAIMWVYAYRIGNLLFDTGCGNAREEVQKCKELEGIKRVILSHYHEDHIGCAGVFDNAQIFAHEPSIEMIKNPEQLGEFFQYVWGQPHQIKRVLPLPEMLKESEFKFEIVSLPGHCEDMIGLYEPNKKWLFSADAVPLPSKKKIAMPEENVPQIIQTLEEIQRMPIDVIFDGHRGPIENPHEHIQTRIDFLKGIREDILRYHRDGKSIQEIQTLLDIEGPWYMDMTEGRFGIDHFISSMIKHSI